MTRLACWLAVERVSTPLLVAGLLLGVSGCGSTSAGSEASDAASSANCGPYDGSIKESTAFTPFEAQRSGESDPFLNPEGKASASVPDFAQVSDVAGLPRQWAITDPDGAVYLYYSDEPIDTATTLSEFRAAGGVSLEVTPSADFGLKQLIDQVGDRAVPVEIGEQSGVVIWADPSDSSGRRNHHVYWETDGQLFGLLIDRPAEKAVTVAREVACGMS